jgi:hypothetical protein
LTIHGISHNDKNNNKRNKNMKKKLKRQKLQEINIKITHLERASSSKKNQQRC